MIDNETFHNTSQNISKQPKYAKLNWVMSLVMIGITASLRSRISGKLNGANLILFPRLHFSAIAQAPLIAPADTNYNYAKICVTVQKIKDQTWSSRNFLANGKPEDGKYLSTLYGDRGNSATQAVDDATAKVEQKMSDVHDLTWIPNNINSNIISVYLNEWHVYQMIPF